jgi:hypothetical protein
MDFGLDVGDPTWWQGFFRGVSNTLPYVVMAYCSVWFSSAIKEYRVMKAKVARLENGRGNEAETKAQETEGAASRSVERDPTGS